MHSNIFFPRKAVPHAKPSPNRKNPDAIHSINARVDSNDNVDIENQEILKPDPQTCHDAYGGAEEMTFHWEDHESFLRDLKKQTVEEEDWDVTLESIQSAFTAKAESLNHSFADLMVPVSNSIRSTTQQIEVNSDAPLVKALDAYDRSVQNLSRSTRDGNREIGDKYLAMKEKISILFQELEEEYQTRDKLWFHYEQALDEHVAAMKDLLRDAPGRMEKTIAKLEKKQAKELESLDMNHILSLAGNH